MRRVTSGLIVASALLAGAAGLYVSRSSAQFASSPFGGGSSSVAAGSLLSADKDAFANTFVAMAQTPDGGAGKYGYVCNQEPCGIKGAAGTQEEIIWHDNEAHIGGTAYLNTAFIQAPASSPQGSTGHWNTGNAWWGLYEFNPLPACGAGEAGTDFALSTDHHKYYCDGTTAQQYGFRKAWSGAIDFGAIAGGSCADGTFAATGAVLSEAVACGGLNLLQDADAALTGSCSASATDTIRVRACCVKLVASCADPASITFSAAALR